MNQKTCVDCGGTYDEEWFAIKDPVHGIFQPRCNICRQTTRDKTKWAEPFLYKARQTLSHHIKSLSRSRDELVSILGWDVQKMARDCANAFANACPYCGVPFKDMGNRLAAITLDIHDPDREPNYNVNTKWICHTCNTVKRNSSPDKWARVLRYMAQWKAQQKVKERNPFCMLPMFKDLA